MRLADYRVTRPGANVEAFSRNKAERRRYVLTFKDGSHLIGVPTVNTTVDPLAADASFTIVTQLETYEIPFSFLAFADRIEESPGQRPSDGLPPVPEPCAGPVQRAKHQKFEILDAPRLLKDDLVLPAGLAGYAVLFLDLDRFKQLNERFTERVVDHDILPRIQGVVRSLGEGHGFAYAEGGDEMIVLLRNTSRSVADAFAEDLRARIGGLELRANDQPVIVTASIGLATSDRPEEFQSLPGWANLAKGEAKKQGRNRTMATTDGTTFTIVPAPTALDRTPPA